MAKNKTGSVKSKENVVDNFRVIVIGPQITELLQSDSGLGERAEIVLKCADLNEWTGLPANKCKADLVIIQCATVFPDTIELIKSRTEETGASRAIVVYHFTQEKTALIMESHSSKITAMRSPISAADLKSVCEADLAMAEIRNLSLNELPDDEVVESVVEPAASEIPDRQFSDELLARVSEISTSIECECPHHLASLILALNAFELYCRQCASRDEKDVMLHSFLHRKTANARLIMENALSTLAEAEGFDLV